VGIFSTAVQAYRVNIYDCTAITDSKLAKWATFEGIKEDNKLFDGQSQRKREFVDWIKVMVIARNE
jgi:hypothetical protein